MDGGAAPTLAPFRFNTRERKLPVGSIAYPTGGGDGVPLNIQPIGLLAKLYCIVEATVTFSSATTYAKFGPWGLIKRLRVSLNNASQDICDLSGWSLFKVNSVIRKVNKIDETAGLDSSLYAAPTSGSSQSLRLAFEVPLNQSNGMNFEAGLLNLQAPEVQATINLTWASATSEIGSNISSFAATAYFYSHYFEVPDPTQVEIPPVVLHKWVEQTQPVSQTGENIYTVPRAGRMSRLLHTLILNGARDDSYDYAQIRAQQSDTLYKRDKREIKLAHRSNYGVPLPTGVIAHDLSQAYGYCEETDGRDFIDTERLTTLESVIFVSSSATLGTGNNQLISVREILQMPANG